MIQRIQSVFLFFAVASILMITYRVPVLSSDVEQYLISGFMLPHIFAIISSFLAAYSIFLFKTRKKQMFVIQISKLMLSVTFFVLFFSKGEMIPDKGMVLFILPYVLFLLANRSIKKDEKLVQSSDRIR
jgi:hypothetical protein